MGFTEANDDMFAKHSWYFRNALVRANYQDLTKCIYKTEKYIIRFLSNLLLNQSHSLQNRVMHIHSVKPINDNIKAQKETVKSKIDTVNEPEFDLIKQNNKIAATEISERLKISLSTATRKIKELKQQEKIELSAADKTGFWKIIEQLS